MHPSPARARLIATLLLGSTGAWLAGCGGATSLAEAILERPDEFPPGTNVVVPPSSRSPLGHRKARSAGERRMSMEVEPCFIVEPRSSSGLAELTVAYDSGSAIEAELGMLAARAGVKIGADARAVLTLRDLTIEEGIGVPDPNTCDFGESTTVTVATRAIRARTAELRFTGGSGTSGGISGAAAEVAGTAGWRIEDGQRGLVAGDDIVLAATMAPVAVTVDEQVIDLGHRVEDGRSGPLPGGLDGELVVERYDVAAGADGHGVLTVRLEPTAGKARAVDDRCDPAASVALGHRRRCTARLGTSAVAFWWEKAGGADDLRVRLRVRSYRMEAR